MIYLDNAATSNHKPFSVKKAVWEALSHPVNVGRNSAKESFHYAEKILLVRENVASLLGVDTPENIVFTANASHALNFAIKGFLTKSAHIITTPFEHNSVLRQLSQRPKNTVSFLPCRPDHTLDLSVLKSLVQDNTELLIVNIASNVTGAVTDYRKVYQMARKLGLTVLFDFSQAIGNLTIDLSGMEHCMAAFSGHKSLLGPQGTGILYVSSDITLNAVLEGGTGSLSNQLYQPDFLPDQFEVGTLNTPGILGLGKGIDFVKKETPHQLLSHKLELVQYVFNELSDMKHVTVYHNGDFMNSIGILSFNVGDVYSEQVAEILSKDYGISTRGGFHCAPLMHQELGTKNSGTVRISPGYKTSKKEMKVFIDAINRIEKNAFS